jgi:hypothetical protein
MTSARRGRAVVSEPDLDPAGLAYPMIPERPHEFRGRPDRRRRPTSPWDAFRPGGRRVRNRRAEERRQPHFVDRIDPPTFTLAVLLLVLTIVDGAVTLLLLGAGCEEINPAMGYLLRRGPLHFLLGKYALTTAGLPFLLIFRNFTLFRTRFRVGYLLPVFVALYLVLLGYQIALMNSPPDLSQQDLGDKPRLAAYVQIARE